MINLLYEITHSSKYLFSYKNLIDLQELPNLEPMLWGILNTIDGFTGTTEIRMFPERHEFFKYFSQKTRWLKKFSTLSYY